MTGEHSSKQYDMDLETIRSQVLHMGGLVEQQFSDAIGCYREGDPTAALRTIAADAEVNRLEVVLDDMCSHLIVRRQPAANDLRTVMATGRLIADLERIGDEASKIARIVRDAGPAPRQPGYDTVRALAAGVGDMLHDALDAFARLDQARAVQLIAQDELIDQDFRAIMRHLVARMAEDPGTIGAALDALWVAKAIERIGDHAKNIAEHVVYIVAGKDIRHTAHASLMPHP